MLPVVAVAGTIGIAGTVHIGWLGWVLELGRSWLGRLLGRVVHMHEVGVEDIPSYCTLAAEVDSSYCKQAEQARVLVLARMPAVVYSHV